MRSRSPERPPQEKKGFFETIKKPVLLLAAPLILAAAMAGKKEPGRIQPGKKEKPRIAKVESAGGASPPRPRIYTENNAETELVAENMEEGEERNFDSKAA